jgi:hypothetical protein
MFPSIRMTIALVVALGPGWDLPTRIVTPGSMAVAQTAAPGAGATPPTQAPIGHRQPRPSDIPPDMEKAAKERDAKDAAEQRRLDRVLRNICRGC